MAALATIAPKLSKLITRLATDHDGEVLATVAAIRRTLESAGLDLHALAEALGDPKTEAKEPATWCELATWCRNQGQTGLSLKEFVFVSDMADRLILDAEPTEKQAAWLRAIYAKLKKGLAH
ncbi:hypothetical protein [Zavarzinia compransoris]|uniref:Uncharacterized protein n=1 Tax=Zavarzinia compransoris TaxID=1264899 RepID=A0A317E0A7_9PROT|nr:hypothetical protein [Zavarzinia compransoris]PWR18793.1 hypothetical protein DKG75_17575 [Zavarzinia compransoris]TDP48778.1 hypothetical protein DES42_101135 [Zavarzinia compransoris]